jgi:hypothetical protein
MILVPISAVPNQSFSITLDGNAYDISLYVTNDVMAIDIIRNNIPLVFGLRVVPYYPVIPYLYLEDGNFIFNTENGDYPYYDQFGVTQQLIYLSQSELNQLRANPV